MKYRASRTTLPQAGAIAILSAALAAACSDKATPPAGGSAATPTSSAAEPSASSAPQPKKPPRTLQGSALALSPDGARVFVADEDHESLFVLPAGLTDEPARVIAAPGPPAQIVALDGLVLVTVRTLPTDDARAAREEIRGKTPTPEGAKSYGATTLKSAPLEMRPWTGKFIHPKDREKWLAGELEAPEPSGSAPRPAKPGEPSPKAKPSGSASASAPPKQGTPSKPFDPNTVRKSQGGLLVGYRPDPEKGLVEAFRVGVAPDAWGLGVTPDAKRAVVTSAWSGEASVIDLEASKVVASLKVDREPRGVAIAADGKTAFISHLVGTALTKITGLDAAPEATSVALPPSPPRTPFGSELGASLAYSLVFSPDGKSLYVPRHALGAEGIGAWWGAPVVDVLDTKTEKHIAPKHSPAYPKTRTNAEFIGDPPDWMASEGQPPGPRPELVQPRATVYRKKTDTLLIASEGWDALTEVDALTVDPAMFVRRTYDLSGAYDAFGHFALRGGAPSAIALSEDEDTAYVFCRTTFDVARIDLATGKASWLHLADDGLPVDAAYGRRLFTNARSFELSGGIGCAACHPDGRDDGYVWREGMLSVRFHDFPRFVGLRANVKGANENTPPNVQAAMQKPKLHPRQTPMLAGRVRASGPYGWHAENQTLIERLLAGFELHRGAWEDGGDTTAGQNIAKIDYLIDYLQSGLLPPPTPVRELSEVEKKGKAIFENKNTANCASCHVPESEFTDRTAYPLRALSTRQGFDEEENVAFKTPSLRFIAGTAPYFHDGSATTLEDLVRKNGTRMGNTSSLSADDQAALVAYLKTL
ncbi:cytochrome c peroxidase [Polyangium aurulentum]|uniref:cytochrome c peroxidase n=1 Tax=Polyangium aurulentum TaxID=2567896 RepID=UPI0010ADCD75|nr:cytochrome c peroxidase [Polyangium aurulentum]UQA62190.1 c-type cytochrome [Polyangium aurulentum]